MALPILKGKAVVAQSGGCTAVINQSLAGVIDAAKSAKSISHLWGSCHGVEGILSENFIDLNRQPKAVLNSIRYQPSSALGSSRYKLKPGDEEQIVAKFKKENIRAFFMIGGNDTAETILRISKAACDVDYPLRAIHIPKTIDNDLVETDHSPGYGSVARFAAITTQEAGLDTKSMRGVDPVKIIELMGRNSGWIVAASALLKKTESDPPHLLLLPEAAFDEKQFLGNVESILKRVGYCIVVISETIRKADGKRVGERCEGIMADPFGHKYVDSAAAILARFVEHHLKVRARYDKPGTIQRMSIPYVSSVDQCEAYAAGRQAVRWALQGRTQVMVSFKRKPGKTYGITYQPVPLEKIPGREYLLPDEFLNAEKNQMTPAFYRYALPLLGGQLPGFSSFRASLRQ